MMMMIINIVIIITTITLGFFDHYPKLYEKAGYSVDFNKYC